MASATGRWRGNYGRNFARRPASGEAVDGPRSKWDHRYRVIEAALSCPDGQGVTAAIKEAASRIHIDHRGRERRYSERHLWRWVERYRAKGFGGLGGHRRADKGSSRVIVTRVFDRDSGLPVETLERIRDDLRIEANSHYAAGNPSRRQIAIWVTRHLMKLAADSGVSIPSDQLRRICRISEPFVRESRHFRLIHIQDHRPKEFYDKYQPVARRTRDGLPPMMIVTSDVHHSDHLMRREDGSVYTPKLIAFQCLGTNRLLAYPVFLPKGEGVRQEHIITAFIAMINDPQWGVPGVLLIDNGGEFKRLGVADDMLKLSARLQIDAMRVEAKGKDSELARVMTVALQGTRSAIRRARAYNARSKPIEGQFGNLEQNILSMFPGFIDGDRMKNPTANQGKVQCSPWSPKEFTQALSIAISYYHSLPQRGHLKGQSPNEAFAAACRAGWQRIDAPPPDVMLVVFSRQITRCIRQGGEITIDNKRYWARELAAIDVGTKVRVCLPSGGQDDRLPILGARDEIICFAEPVTTRHFLDAAGAADARGRVAAQSQQLGKMRGLTRPVQVLEEMIETIAMDAPPPIPLSAGRIRVDEEAHKIARARSALPKPAAPILKVNPQVEKLRRLSPSYRDETAGGAGPPAALPESSTSDMSLTKAKRGHK